MNIKILILLVLFFFIVSGCKKTQTEVVISDGTYSGKMFDMNGMSALAMPGIYNVSFQIVSQSQIFIGAQNVNYIPTGAGTYKVSRQEINFTETEVFPDNTTVNTIAVLSGSYSYTIKGDSLFLTKNNTGINNITYKLKKQ